MYVPYGNEKITDPFVVVVSVPPSTYIVAFGMIDPVNESYAVTLTLKFGLVTVIYPVFVVLLDP